MKVTYSLKNVILVFLFIVVVFSNFSFQQKQKFDLKASIERGREIYSAQCASCHMQQGEGLESVYPPLAKSDYLMADKKRSIQQILHGITGEIKVNGVTYNSDMPGFAFSDQEVSDVLNFVRNSWGNKGEAITPDEVKATKQ